MHQKLEDSIKSYILESKNGNIVELLNIGASIRSLKLVDSKGCYTDIVAGYKMHSSYINDSAAMGKIVGRFANRIAYGKFSIGQKDYLLPINNGRHHLHGGADGLHNKIWNTEVGDNYVQFSILSNDLDCGYPGNLSVTVLYKWDDDNTLKIILRAKTDKLTVVNLTSHAYFNLNGVGCGSILNHYLKINSSSYLEIDKETIPTGSIINVDQTLYDFREFRKIGNEFDNYWIINSNKDSSLKKVAELKGDISNIEMKIFSTQPGIQIYTGNWLSECKEPSQGGVFENYDAIALECQNFPDAPNHEDFPNSILTPEDLYEQIIVYKFQQNEHK